jgi:hypothetical protein
MIGVELRYYPAPPVDKNQEHTTPKTLNKQSDNICIST